MYRADTIDQAAFLLTVTDSTVLLCDTVFLDGTCILAAEMIHVVHPGVSLVVVTEELDSPCWKGALRRIVGTVHKPLRLDELGRAIRAAHRASGESH